MSAERLAVAVFGSAGRMGRALGAALDGHARLALHVAQHTGSDIELLQGCAVAIDFTTPEASIRHAEAAARHGVPLVVGTTGLGSEHNAVLERCARTVPTVYSANMSVGVTLLAALVKQAAERLGPEYDIEVAEMHHRRKVDAPSGTALLLGEAAARGRGAALDALRAGTDRNGERREGEIGFATLRGGDVAGTHTVYFAGEGETLELTHRASSRALFAAGALRAAEWVIGKPPGLYGMRDVLAL